MKGYKRLWFMSFIVSLAALCLAIFVFMNFMKNNMAEQRKPSAPEQTPQLDVENTYYEPQDNVGAVSFTEDQMTELARKLFSLDGFLNDLSLDLKEGEIGISAKIKDKDKLIEVYPELKKFNAVLTAIERKKMSVKGIVTNNDGRAAIKIKSVSVGDMKIDGDIISPFVEADDFSSLFDVEYENIEISDGEVVFKNGVPDILKY